jgi:hypothetical protein
MDLDADPAISVSDLHDVNKKKIFSSKFRILLFSSVTFKTSTKNDFFSEYFCFLLFEGTFTSFLKDKKKSSRSHKAGIKAFPTIFA